MEITVVKEFTFDAAHQLPYHAGKCKGLHGHTYRMQIGIKGVANPHTGMVVDFSEVKELVNQKIINKLDHSYLNDQLPYESPTAENMVIWIIERLYDLFAIEWEGKARLSFVRLYETPTSYAEWRG
jgi:6-pyruvoyltetrahydropterin/6-carboxytetrahydropterin synthase